MKNVLLFTAVVWLAVLGSGVLAFDVFANHTLHMVNAIVGGGMLLLAVGLALPLQLADTVKTVAPYIPFGRRKTDV